MTDREMLERFVTGRDEDAFEGLVVRHGPMVLGLCRQILRDAHEAEDAFQATFLVLARNATTIRNLDSVGSWLHGVAYRLAVRAKTDARRRVSEGRDPAMIASRPDDDPDRRETRLALRDEVNRLPEKYRAPVVLCFFEGQTHEEAARGLACPTGTVKGRLARAKEMLRARLDRRGVAIPLALVGFFLADEARAAVPDELVRVTVANAMNEATAVAIAPEASRPFVSPRLLALTLLLLVATAIVARFGGEHARPLRADTATVGRHDPAPGFGPARCRDEE